MRKTDESLSFAAEGSDRFDFWTVNGEIDWAWIPRSETGLYYDLPVRLQVGDARFGYKHVQLKHPTWVSGTPQGTVEDLLWEKLGQSGAIYSSEEEKKVKIVMNISPGAFLVLREAKDFTGTFLTVVTMYFKQGHTDGSKVGEYKGRFREDHQKDS